MGMIQGAVYREVLRIPADEGEPLDVEASIFLSPDWRGPNFIGTRASSSESVSPSTPR